MITSMTDVNDTLSDRLERAAQIFYRQVFADPMIGFMFLGLDQARLAAREFELMARVCGLEIEYQGRGLAAAHRRHNIRRGQFARRLVLLKSALEDAGVPSQMIETIVRHNERLAPVILGAALNDPNCNHPNDEDVSGGVKVYS